jgi:hypothetical protein
MASNDVLALLRSIDASLKQLVQIAQRRQQAPAAPVNGSTIAPDSDLDGKFGDEAVKFTPRDYSGTKDYKGRRMSECSPAFLDALAASYDYFAQKNTLEGTMASNGKPKADYDRRAAARARGWAARLRSGWKHPETDGFGESDWPQPNRDDDSF